MEGNLRADRRGERRPAGRLTLEREKVGRAFLTFGSERCQGFSKGSLCSAGSWPTLRGPILSSHPRYTSHLAGWCLPLTGGCEGASVPGPCHWLVDVLPALSVSTFPLFRGNQSYWIRAHPRDLTLVISAKTLSINHSHSEALGVRTPT